MLKASTLEWMIIILIVIEVIFDTLHYMKSGQPQSVVIVSKSEEEVKAIESGPQN